MKTRAVLTMVNQIGPDSFETVPVVIDVLGGQTVDQLLLAVRRRAKIHESIKEFVFIVVVSDE